MKARLQPWILVIGLIAICVGAISALYWYRARIEWTPATMASYLPRVNATVIFIDFEKLRSSGLFDTIVGSKALEELEYRQFVDQTNFDYRSDLDRLAIAFQGDNRFAVARGRFDWKKINQYLLYVGGTCHNSVCTYQDKQPLGRWVSYFPIRPTVMGLYSGTADGGVYEVAPRHLQDDRGAIPDAPLWVSVPASQWNSSRDMPAGAKTFAAVFGDAERVMFSANADATTKNFMLYADITCAAPDAAVKLGARLIEATDKLRQEIAKAKTKPAPGEISTLLAAGNFTTEGAVVKATWPLDKAFVESLASGNVN